MSNKAIILKRNTNDQAKYDQLLALKPRPYVQYSSSGQLVSAARDFGNQDYLLFTGGHGDFLNSRPALFNDTTIEDLGNWSERSSGSFKAIILDTCFSSALVPRFLPFVPYGGCVICAHGSSEGWADGFSKANGAKSVGDILSDVVDNMQAIGIVSALAIAVHKPHNQLLYTMNAGAGRGPGLAARDMMDMDHDSEEELKQLDTYLFGTRVTVVETAGVAQFKLMLAASLPMRVL